MITARSSSGAPRTRGIRSPLLLLWSALLLLGLLDAHGIGAGSGDLHHGRSVSASAVPSQALVFGADTAAHPAEQCMPGRSERGTAPAGHPQASAGPATRARRADASAPPQTTPRTCGAPLPPAHGVLRL
ncbi:hypothetical protein AW27_004180 [Streptomyces sp. PCS3-D2]|uniref:hypothetical protein n=1 Tax=Streptomyces sp. PCS3-D2 TaxID=1460244 RepID=UPI00044E58A8|nr:hypothetical protein [Streptomyces sp. PCS3-D2]WKV70787.1 hypothetical protein AW27_004180 [Streptomyces sp. PCS3-D2]